MKTRHPLILLVAIALLPSVSSHASLIFSEDFESPVTAAHSSNVVPDNGQWIGASGSFGSGRRGLYNENGISFSTADGAQAYGFWYNAQAGITTTEGTIGAIQANTRYQLTFNYGNIAGDTTNPIDVLLLAYNSVPSASRTAVHSDSGSLNILGQFTGTAATSTLAQRGVINFDSSTTPGVVGQDLAIRLRGSNHFGTQTGNAILYDNVSLIIIPEPSSVFLLCIGGVGLVFRRSKRAVVER